MLARCGDWCASAPSYKSRHRLRWRRRRQPHPCEKPGCNCNRIAVVTRSVRDVIELDGHRYFVDCAAASLDEDVPIAGLVVRGTPVHAGGCAFSCMVPPPAPMLEWSRGKYVEVIQLATGALTAPNQILVHGLGGPFALPGDSGALVVDEDERVVGLLWGASPTARPLPVTSPRCSRRCASRWHREAVVFGLWFVVVATTACSSPRPRPTCNARCPGSPVRVACDHMPAISIADLPGRASQLEGETVRVTGPLRSVLSRCHEACCPRSSMAIEELGASRTIIVSTDSHAFVRATIVCVVRWNLTDVWCRQLVRSKRPARIAGGRWGTRIPKTPPVRLHEAR